MIKGALNLVTCGLFAGIKKVFKGFTGYTKRFGFPEGQLPGDNFNHVQRMFQESIHLSAKGQLPIESKDYAGKIRPVMRIFFGMRHQAESVLKEVHDAYLIYANQLASQKITLTDTQYSLHAFFGSTMYQQKKQSIAANLRVGEEPMLGQVEQYLSEKEGRIGKVVASIALVPNVQEEVIDLPMSFS